MSLESYKFNFSPQYLEAIMVMGNGATIVNDDFEHPLVFFDNGLPDISISNCLKILGFEFEDFYLKEDHEIDSNVILKKLKELLSNGSVIVSPLDMGYLNYNPNQDNFYGVDHSVCVYNLDENYIYLHDPAGYACMKIKFEVFLKSWKANSIEYKRGSYSMWGNLKRVKIPTTQEIYNDTSIIMKKRYQYGDSNIIENYSKSIEKYGLNEEQKEIHKYFSLN